MYSKVISNCLNPQRILWKPILSSVYTVPKKLQEEQIRNFVTTTAEVVTIIIFIVIEVTI